ncbi:RkpR, polysaccharide export protein [Roseibium aestuarii]|uniref:RkpR, polysaccharide export protein n=1 Tax=Roseibium aestuarii TaxID=2600299 RepID=A0ABW4JYL8_9HYPH|nr:RkpR, polysaccharide export protein [Roseibium aestuarii]
MTPSDQTARPVKGDKIRGAANGDKTVSKPAREGAFVALPEDGKARPDRASGSGDLVARLKKTGLDPHRLLDLALPGTGTSSRSRPRTRHRLIVLGFFLFVALPSLLFSGYMAFFASDQYNSTVAFAIRSSTQGAATDILGLVLDSGSESTASNSYILQDYIRSQAILEDLEPSLDLTAIFNRSGADWLFRMGEDLPIEARLDYWESMVDVHYDATSGVINVDVRSFDPNDSVRVAEAILARSDALVNQLSDANRRETLRFAEETVARAETRLRAIRREMSNYRDKTQEVSPEDNARLTMEMIAGLEQEIASKTAELSILSSYQVQDSPRVRLLQETISALEAQVDGYRNKLGDGRVAATEGERDTAAQAALSRGDRLSQRISTYTDLKLEEEFSNRFYATALAGLEKARQDAAQKHMYLATFIKPTLSEQAQYPHRLAYSLFTALALFGLWGVAVLLYYNIRDRN